MDPTNPTTPEIPVVEAEKKDGHWVTIAAMALFVAASLIAVGFLYYQNQQLKAMLASYQTQSTPTPVATADPTANWKTYTNNKYGFEFRYPSDWTDMASIPEDVLFFKSIDDQVHFVVKKSTSINQLIQNLGINNQENITFNDVKFTKILYYTKEAGDIVEYVIAKNNDLLIFSGNTKVLSTFKFLGTSPNPTCKPRPACLDATPRCLIPETSDMCPPSPVPTQKACTQEAKLCPDGSSVGRTGPNCEFAPCPTSY